MIHIKQINRNLQQSHFTNDVIWYNYNMLDLEKIMCPVYNKINYLRLI